MVQRGTNLAHVREDEYRDRLADAQASLTQAKADYERTAGLYENNNVSKADYDAAFARSQSTQARYAQAAQTLSDCSLVAPMDGTLLKRSIEIGTLVAPGGPAFVLADTRNAKVVFGVPDVTLARVHMGDTLTVTTEALPGRTLHGWVTRIAPSADANSRIFEVECTIPNADGGLKIGMIAALEVQSTTSRQVVTLVPLKAVVRSKTDPKGYAVYVVDATGGKPIARIHDIQLGDVVGNSIAVLDGLSGGEQIVVVGVTLVSDQMEVRIVP